MSGAFLVIGILLAWILFLALVACWEKRMVWPYGVLQEQPQFVDESGYGSRWVGEARSLGCIFLGWAPDMKGPLYRVSYGFLVSPNRDCLIIVGVGNIMKMKLRGTWAYSVSIDGNVLYSADNQACISMDVSRQWRTQLVATSTLAGLLVRHYGLCQLRGFTPRCFSAGREFDEFKNLREEHYQSLARKGLITFTDHAGSHWRYTFYGALKWAFLNNSIGLLRGLTHGRIPRCA